MFLIGVFCLAIVSGLFVSYLCSNTDKERKKYSLDQKENYGEKIALSIEHECKCSPDEIRKKYVEEKTEYHASKEYL